MNMFQNAEIHDIRGFRRLVCGKVPKMEKLGENALEIDMYKLTMFENKWICLQALFTKFSRKQNIFIQTNLVCSHFRSSHTVPAR